MTQEALKLALEALVACNRTDMKKVNEAITAIKEALAEHAMRETQRLEQEIEQKIGCVNHDCDQCKAQRTEPAQQKKVWTFWDLSGGDITDAIKAKLKEKNQ